VRLLPYTGIQHTIRLEIVFEVNYKPTKQHITKCSFFIITVNFKLLTPVHATVQHG